MPGKTFRFTGLTKGVYAASNPFDQPQGSLPRVHNMLLTERGGLLTIDGTHIVSGPLGNTPPFPPTPPASPYAGIYVANFFDPSFDNGGISIWPLTANGDVAPSGQITGATTTLLNPRSVCVDSQGYVYVADAGVPTAVSIFAPGASGDVAPTYVLTGGSTNITNALYVRIGPDGFLWICNGGSGGSAGSILRFPLRTGGNVAPTSKFTSVAINPGGSNDGGPTSIDWDAAQNFYVPNYNQETVQSYPDSEKAGLLVLPTTQITSIASSPIGPYGIAVVSTNIHVSLDFSNNPGFVYEWPTSATGAASPSATLGGTTAAGLNYPLGMHKDSSGNIWIANGGVGTIPPGIIGSAILSFPSTATGDVAPTVSITGASTLLNDPFDVFWFQS